MQSTLLRHSIFINGRKTSVSIEDAFWRSLKEVAHERRETLSNLIAKIDVHRQHNNLSSAVRLFVLDWARDRASAQVPKQREELAVA